MDQHTFASLAHIRILLLPIGVFEESSFENLASVLKDFDEIRLSDVPADSRDERARFMPNPLANGSLLLTFTRLPPSAARMGLSIFRPSDFPLGVVGIAACSQSDALTSIYGQFNRTIADLFPHGSIFPLARNCFVFEEGEGNTGLHVDSGMQGMVVIPEMMGNKKLYIGTLLAELCSNILGEFSVMVKALETPQGSESLNAGLFGNILDFSNSIVDESTVHTANVMQHSQPDIASGGSMLSSNDVSRLPLKRASTLGPGISVANNRGSMLLVPPGKRRQITLNTATSHARLYKVLGDLFLMAGRTMDATIWYNEALALFKQSQDMPWQAAALEGISVAAIVDAWSTGHSAASEASQPKEPWMEISEKLLSAVSLYSGVAMQTNSSEVVSDLAFLYVSASLRHSSLLYFIWSSKGWNPLAFSVLLHGDSHFASSAIQSTAFDKEMEPDLSGIYSGISRVDVSGSLFLVHGPWLLHLSFKERIEVLRSMSRMYSTLGYRRKEAYVLRELLACLMDLLIQGREETKKSSSSISSSHLASLDGQSSEQGSLGMREKENDIGNASILQLAKHICKIHGVVLDAVVFTDDLNSNLPLHQGKRPFVLLDFYNTFSQAKADQCIWPDLQVGLAREALAVAEALPDYSAVTLFSLSALSQLTSIFDPDDQYHFYMSSARAMTTIQRRGEEKRLQYWPGELVVSIRFIPPPLTRVPLERPWSDFDTQNRRRDLEVQARVDPFLYNPRRATNGARQVLVVENEIIEFAVALRNPFSISLEILHISLSTNGVPFESHALPVVLSANSYQIVTMSGKAMQSGVLHIRGCRIELPGTVSYETLVPILSDEEEEVQFFKAIAQANEIGRLKSQTLKERSQRNQRLKEKQHLNGHDEMQATHKYLELRVVPEQPLLRVRRSSLTNDAVMLYEGETSAIRVTLENISSFSVDFLDVSFEDSIKSYAEQALAEAELSAFDTYETEYSIVHRPVFTWLSNEDCKKIPPGKEVVVTINCFGKAGCFDGMVQFSYSSVQRDNEKVEGPLSCFYTRQLPFPVLFTVFQMLECSGMNIVPLSSLGKGVSEDYDMSWEALLKDTNDFDWCALTLDVQNMYGLPFEVTLMSESKVACRIVPPGSTYRFFLPIRRFSLSTSTTSSHIPSLTNRQFVVTGLTSDADRAQRELFWYREELLSRVTASWKEAEGLRKGELSLRSQRFTLSMLNALRTEIIRTRLSLTNLSDETVFKESNDSYLSLPNRPVYLKITVENISDSPLTLAFALNMEPSDYVLYNGILNDIPLGCLQSGQTLDHQMVFVFTAQGQFNLSAKVSAIDGEGRVDQCGSSHLVILSREVTA